MLEEGSPCPQEDCDGTLEPSEVVNCSCHINPPCSACVDAGYTCDICYWESDPKEIEIEIETSLFPVKPFVDRSSETTSTKVDNPFNSTPFTRCCGVAAINEARCPSCNAEITWHDDGLAQRRREVKGGCLMCGKPVGDIRISGNCCC